MLKSSIVAIVIAVLLLTRQLPAAADEAGYLYTYAVDSTRYADIFAELDAYKPLGSKADLVRPYFDLFVSRDSKTGTDRNVPLILSDNYVLGAFGLQYTNNKGLRAFVQGGESEKFGTVAAQPSGGDVRGGLQLYREWGTGAASRGDSGSLYTSAVYYSRYSDWVSYSQLEIVHAIGARRRLEPFLREVLNLDTQDHYYSNLAETSAGLRWLPFGAHGIRVEALYAVGVYLRNALRPAGQAQSYSDFRPTISYGMNL